MYLRFVSSAFKLVVVDCRKDKGELLVIAVSCAVEIKFVVNVIFLVVS